MTTDTYSETGRYRPWIAKDPNAILDYTFNWTDWLATNSDSISSYTVTVDGVTLASDSRLGAYVTAWVSGGDPTVQRRASITCRIVTAAGRTEDRTIYLIVEAR